MMRKSLIWLVLVVVMLAGAGVVAENLIVGELRRLEAQGQAFSAERIDTLPQPLRIGAHVTSPVAAISNGAVRLDSADLWIEPLSPFTARIGLPGKATIEQPDGMHELTFDPPSVTARFQPLAGLAPGEVNVATSNLVLDGAPFAQSANIAANAVPVDPSAPASSQAGYDVNWKLEGLDPKALPVLASLTGALEPEDRISFEGQGRFWLDKVPTPRAMAALPSPMMTGLRFDRAELHVGALSARVLGRLDADAQGRAQGALAIYTSDAIPMLDAAAEAGMIPKRAVPLAQAMMRRVSAMPVALSDQAGAAVPDAAKGELRLPLTFAEGRMSLGPIPLGAAPRLRP
ncbi:DUF2125 domain-containing protein [Paracoccus sp. KR1-242]|uniref:DUF2125 domain-containing protein n=1 Tax=Paracoccus sp. KR1-242 TaxID=3410028 RepID=UPI003BFCCEDD